MERRTFLEYCAVAGLSSAFSGPVQSGSRESSLEGEENPPVLIADPHAHHYQLHGSRKHDPSAPTIEMMKSLGMALCSFSAVGDMTYYRGHSGMPFNDTQTQLGQVRRLEQNGELQLVLNVADLQSLLASRRVNTGLMAIEGGDALEGRLQHLDVFHEYGVRLMTLIHDRDNELGFNQRSGFDGPLTPFGVQVVEKMNKLGMIVDVAHAKTRTLKSIVEVCAMPLIDSHTSPFLPGEEGTVSRRLRTWQEMEMVAGTGGVVCTWPYAYSGKRSQRTTLKHWAEEIVLMKSRLGIEHCGLGTDGGGGLPSLVEGWDSIASLPRLMAAMQEAGLAQGDIAAYVGGNFLRVLEKCLA